MSNVSAHGIEPLKSLKMFGIVVCVLLIVGTIPSIYLIALELIEGNVLEADRTHFIVKFLAYISEITILAYIAFRLIKATRAPHVGIQHEGNNDNQAIR